MLFSPPCLKKRCVFRLSKRNMGCIKLLLRTFSFFDIVTLILLVFICGVLSFYFKLELKFLYEIASLHLFIWMCLKKDWFLFLSKRVKTLSFSNVRIWYLDPISFSTKVGQEIARKTEYISRQALRIQIISSTFQFYHKTIMMVLKTNNAAL